MQTSIGKIDMLKQVSMSIIVHIARLCPNFLLTVCCCESELVVVFDEPSVCTTIFSSICKRRIVSTQRISHTTINSMAGPMNSITTICCVLNEVTAIYSHTMSVPSGIGMSSNVDVNNYQTQSEARLSNCSTFAQIPSHGIFNCTYTCALFYHVN